MVPSWIHFRCTTTGTPPSVIYNEFYSLKDYLVISSDFPREDAHQVAPKEASVPLVNKQVLGGGTCILFGETECLDSPLLAPERRENKRLHKIVVCS